MIINWLFYIGIHVPPGSVNISRDGVALINCTATATFIGWEANGKPVDSLRNQGFDDSAPTVLLNESQNLRMATLKVVGSSNSSNVSVVCVALLPSSTTDFIKRSEAALILVQGG